MRSTSVENEIDDDVVDSDDVVTTHLALPAPSVTSNAVAGHFPTSPILGLDLSADDEAAADTRADRARSHEAAAEVLADRGEWRRAYLHLRAAMKLVHVERSQPVEVPEQLRNEVDRLRRERAEAREQSRRDSLTASYNRRYLDERLATLREEQPSSVCVALVDVDHFKTVNDGYGHAVGDQVLRRIVSIVEDVLPTGGFCARYGGEEFAVVLPDSGHDGAVTVAETLRGGIAEHPWDEIAPGLRVTVSVGVACLPVRRHGVPAAHAPHAGAGTVRDHPSGRHGAAPRHARPATRPRVAVTDRAAVSAALAGEGAEDPHALDATDALLYVAKRAGRNAVAYRDPATGHVRLAGAAAHRRALPGAVRSVFGRA